MDFLSQVPWADIGPTGLLTLTVLAIIQGWLVPRRTYNALVAVTGHHSKGGALRNSLDGVM